MGVAKDIGIVLGVIGAGAGVGLLYWWLKRRPPAPVCEDIMTEAECLAAGCYWWDAACHSVPPVPPEKHRMTVEALADSVGVRVSLTVDTTSLITPGYLDLDPGAYTITAPDEIEVAGEIYKYNTHEVT